MVKGSDSRWRRWRYVVAVSGLVALPTVIAIGLLATEPLEMYVWISMLLAAAAVAADLLIWRALGDQLRTQGWEW